MRLLEPDSPEPPLAGARFLVTEYPNPTNLWRVPRALASTNDELDTECGTRGGSAITFTPGPLHGAGIAITHDEIAVIDREVWPSVQRVVTGIASALGAEPITGIDREFQEHGYCAPALSLPGGRVRWINTVLDSRIQGFWLAKHDGAMHPNIRGQSAYARHIFEAVRKAECDGKIALDDDVRADLCSPDRWQKGLPGYGPDADAVPPPAHGLCDPSD
ncbi:MAG: hypothetical protein QM820_06125 [Minicystis sp.]